MKRIVSAQGKRHLNVLVYDLQIVICPGSLTGKPDSHVLLEMKRNPFNNLKRIDEHSESIYGPALCVNYSFHVSTVSSV